MIYSNKGTTAIDGMENDVLADLAVVIKRMIGAGVDGDKILMSCMVAIDPRLMEIAPDEVLEEVKKVRCEG